MEFLIEYLHVSSNNIYYINRIINQEEYDEFQESENPEDLGFTYICNYSEILQRIHDANEE
jgi:hypothetical protein